MFFSDSVNRCNLEMIMCFLMLKYVKTVYKDQCSIKNIFQGKIRNFYMIII